MADDLTYLDLPIYGGKNIKTPNIDGFRKEAMKFNKAFVSMAICTPSRSEFLTGKYPLKNGAIFNHASTKAGTKSMVHYLKELGYRVGLAGKIHIKPKSVYPFEYVEGIESRAVAETAECNLDGVSDFMKKKGPFGLMIALTTPHAPWTVGNPEAIDLESLELPPYLADTRITRESYRKYLAEIVEFDNQVGQILGALKETGKASNTLVLLTSEQGSQFPFNKWTNFNAGIHTGMLIKWPGNVKTNSETDALVQYADVLPTLIEICGGKVKEDFDFDGTSFVDVLKGETSEHRKYAYALHHNIPEGPPYPIRSVTDGTYHFIKNLSPDNVYIEKHLMGKHDHNPYWVDWLFEAPKREDVRLLVQNYMARKEEQFFDLNTDPCELKDLSDVGGLGDIKKTLALELESWMKDQEDIGEQLDSWKIYRITNTN